MWSVLAYLYPVEDNKNKTSSYSMHFNKFNRKGLDVPMRVEDIPKFENLKIGLRISVLELTGPVLTPIHINTNYDQPQMDYYCIKITFA